MGNVDYCLFFIDIDLSAVYSRATSYHSLNRNGLSKTNGLKSIDKGKTDKKEVQWFFYLKKRLKFDSFINLCNFSCFIVKNKKIKIICALLILIQNIHTYIYRIIIGSSMSLKVRCKPQAKMNVPSAKGIKRKQIKRKAKQKKKLRAGLSEKENNNKL